VKKGKRRERKERSAQKTEKESKSFKPSLAGSCTKLHERLTLELFYCFVVE
jgi:hypothetical protein